MDASEISVEHRLALEHGVTRVLAGADTPATAAAPLIESVCRVLGWRCGAWWLVEPGGEAPVCVGGWGVDAPGVAAFLEVTRTMTLSRQHGGLIRRVWLDGEALWLEDVTAEPSFRRAAAALQAGLHSALAFPVRSGTEVVGIVEFFSASIRKPDAALLDSMLHVGSQIGDFARRTQAEAALRRSEALLRALNELSSDWFWEQDTQFRFVKMGGGGLDKLSTASQNHLGKTRWDLPCLNLTDADWQRHREQLERHEPFRNLEIQRPDRDGKPSWASISGEPIFDADGRFAGYRGVGRDISAQKRAEEDLRRFRLAMDKSADIMVLVDRQSMRYVDVNETACRMLGYTREELLRMGPHDVLSASREALERAYDRLIADPVRTQEMRGEYRRKDGSVFPFDSTRHVLSSGGSHIIAAISRDVSGRIAAEKALRASEARFRSLTELSSDWYWEQDASLRFIKFEGRGLAGAKYDPAAVLLGKRIDEVPGLVEDSVDWDAHHARLARREAFRDLEYAYRDQRGITYYVSVNGQPVFDDDGSFTGYRGTSRDITERKVAEQQIVRSGRMFAALSATNEAIMRAASPEDLYRRVCEAAVDGGKFLTTAVVEPEPGGACARVVAVSGPAGDDLRAARLSTDAETAEGRGLTGTAFRTGAPCVIDDFAADERTAPWRENARRSGINAGAAIPLLRDGGVAGVMLFYATEKRAFDADIVRLLERMAENVVFGLDNFAREAERRQAEQRVQYLASHDSLTGLPNRAMFGQLLGHAIDSGQRYNRDFAVLFIDLDRFKAINDTLGHHAGDELLQTVAARLKKSVRASDVVARLGGDEFVVLIQEVRNAKQVATVARKILSAAMRPLKLAGQELRVTASVGVAMYPEHAKQASDLMRCADLAMYLAKEEGKNNFQIYSADIRSASLERMALEANLRRALELGEFTVHYQAKQDLRSGEITGVEALLRWNSAHLGSISPAQFIPVAEETGLIVPIGRWVLQAACAQHMAWLRDGLPPVAMAVNLSPRQFAAPDLLADIDGALARTGMKAEFLELEITEGIVMQNPERAVALLRAIKARGIRLAIDDFGTGYSSLAQLKRFPIDTLKVDRSFIRDLPQDLEDKAITEAIIAMAKTLSLTVVAEGVETAEQRAFLRDRLCDEMQGYYFSKPLPAAECAALLRKVLAERSTA
jgi:diguanylate cyclase (GGDEF)-like protein/PAS domain S-box-containing protein